MDHETLNLLESVKAMCLQVSPDEGCSAETGSPLGHKPKTDLNVLHGIFFLIRS